jgi:hypothetical protein
VIMGMSMSKANQHRELCERTDSNHYVHIRGSDYVPLPPESRTLPSLWDSGLVGERLVQAFVTLDRLPRLRGPRQPGDHWPGTIIEWADRIAQAELEESERRTRQQAANRTVILASAVEITQMEVVFGWLRELRGVDSGLAVVATFWAMRAAQGRSMKALCAEKHWAPRTFFRKRAKAFATLAGRLNDRRAPVF